MSLVEVLPTVRALSRVEKLRLIQLLAEELVGAEDAPLLEAGRTCPVWSPYDAHEAADVLLQMLEKEKARP